MFRRDFSSAASRRLWAGALCFLFLAALTMPVAVRADDDQEVRIVAVVNDKVISAADVQNRLKLVTVTSNLPSDPESMKELEPQVLRQMIDEKLEMQEADKLDVTVDKGEVHDELASLEQENNLPPGGLDKFLAQKGIDPTTLADQIRANIAWAQVVRRRWAPFTSVGDEEINERIKEIEAHRQQPEDHVAEIYLPVGDPAEDPEVQDMARRLVDQIRGGARFVSVARQFSQDPSAAAGGDLGWIEPGSLSPEKEQIIKDLKPGELGGPFRLAGGYYVFALIDRRTGGADDDMQVSLVQTVFPAPATADDATVQAEIAKARAATAGMRSCGELEKLGKQISPQLSGPLGAVRLGDLPPQLRPVIREAKVAVPTQPMPTRGGIGVYMVCQRQGGEIDRATVENQIMRQRLNNRAVQYLSDLRRVAYIDLRAAS